MKSANSHFNEKKLTCKLNQKQFSWNVIFPRVLRKQLENEACKMQKQLFEACFFKNTAFTDALHSFGALLLERQMQNYL